MGQRGQRRKKHACAPKVHSRPSKCPESKTAIKGKRFPPDFHWDQNFSLFLSDRCDVDIFCGIKAFFLYSKTFPKFQISCFFRIFFCITQNHRKCLPPIMNLCFVWFFGVSFDCPCCIPHPRFLRPGFVGPDAEDHPRSAEGPAEDGCPFAWAGEPLPYLSSPLEKWYFVIFSPAIFAAILGPYLPIFFCFFPGIL